MTSSGVFPKIDGDILYAYDVSSVFDEIGRNSAGVLFNAMSLNIAGNFGGAGELQTTDYNNVGYAWNYNANTLSGNSTAILGLDGGNDYICFMGSYDKFGAALSGTMWTTVNEVSAGTGNLVFDGTGVNDRTCEAYTDGTGNAGIDYKTCNRDVEINLGTIIASNDHTFTVGICANAGANITALGTISPNQSPVCRILIDNSAQKAVLYKNGVQGTWTSISTPAQWRLYFKSVSDASVGGFPTCTVGRVMHTTGSAISTDYISAAITTGSIRNGVLFIPNSYAIGSSASTTYNLSANNGTNLTTINLGSLSSLTTGSNIVVKVTAQENTTFDVSGTSVNWIVPVFPAKWGFRGFAH